MRPRAQHRRPSRVFVFAALVAWAALLPQLASASVVVGNRMAGEVARTTEGPRLYGYHQGDRVTFDLRPDFDTGTYVDTTVDATGTLLQLAAGTAGPWWDFDWAARRCFDIANPGPALTEHQVRIVFDSTSDLTGGLVQANGADYRALAADDSTQLDLFVESGVGTADTIVWVQLDLAAAAATTFCLYFGNPTATSVSSEGDVFTYTSQRQLYFTVSDRFNGSGGNRGTLDVVSFVDNNQVTVGGDARVLNAGDLATFTNVAANTTILTSGPVAGRGRGNAMDSLVPISFAGTDFVFPTNRGTQRWSMVSPTGAVADVQIYNGTALAWTGSVGGTPVHRTQDVGGGRSGVIRVTNGVPILVVHASTQLYDAMTVPPFFGDDLYGVRSRGTFVGVASGPASVDIYRSDATMQMLTGLTGGSALNIYDSADLDGNGTAIRFTNMSDRTGGLQQADRDGLESTAYLPERLLESEYYLPSDAQYIAFACPTSATISVGAQSIPCAPPLPGYPGHGAAAAAPAGTRIFSTNGAPFFAYYEDQRNGDETNLFGMKSAQNYAADMLTVTPLGLELAPTPPTTGTWTSPVIDTLTSGTNVFGLLTAVATLPAGTNVTMQIARGATPAAALSAPFVGPDGTAATSFAAGENSIPYVWDFADPFYVVRVQLETTTAGVSPTVDAVSLGYDLPELGRSSVHTLATSTGTDDDWVVRVWTEDPAMTGAGATLIHRSSSGLTAASNLVASAAKTPQIEIAGGVVIQTSGPAVAVGPGLPHSVTVKHAGMTGAVTDATWQAQLAGTGILVLHELELRFA